MSLLGLVTGLLGLILASLGALFSLGRQGSYGDNSCLNQIFVLKDGDCACAPFNAQLFVDAGEIPLDRAGR